jgi:hypothetical protein
VKFRCHLAAVPEPGEQIMPPLPRAILTEVTEEEKTESMALFIMTTGRDTLLRLRAVEDDADELTALLRSLPQRALSGAEICGGVRDRDAFVCRMIAYEEGRREGIREATGLDWPA